MAFGNPFGTGMNPMGTYGGVNYQQYQQNQQQFNQYPYGTTNQQSQGRSDLIQVNGIDGARNYQIPANSRVALFDANTDVFYIKQTDAGGYPTLTAYQFTAVKDMNGAPVEYVTRQEYNDLVKEIEELKNGKFSVQQEPKPATE